MCQYFRQRTRFIVQKNTNLLYGHRVHQTQVDSNNIYIFTYLTFHSSTSETMALLKCIEVSKEFGGLQALKKVDLTVNENEITGLVGPNGSGKSTLLNVISGVYKPDSGRILFINEDISKLPPYAVCSRGVTKTSQTVQSFPDMTTVENVLIGVLFARKREKENNTDSAQKAKELLDFVRLGADKFNVPA